MKIKDLLLLVPIAAIWFGIAFSNTGCASLPTGPQVDASLLQFAETAQNIIQTVNKGVGAIAPYVATAAQTAQLFIHGAQSTAILNKITTIANQVSVAGSAAGLPPAVVQAQVSAVLTPATATAIVQQVQATVPAN